MNAKEKNLNNLYKARVAHLKWVNTIKLLVSGFKVEKSHLTLPIIQDSEVGAWYYNQALQFSQFHSRNVVEEMETILEKMYDCYAKIYAIYFSQKENSFIGFFGKKDYRINHNEKELASRYYEDIVKFSDEFKSKLHTFERQLTAMPESDHNVISDFTLTVIVSNEKIKSYATNEERSETAHYSLRGR